VKIHRESKREKKGEKERYRKGADRRKVKGG